MFKFKLSASLLQNCFLVAVLFGLIWYGDYNFGTNLKKDIEAKKELDSLTKEKLRLEIQLKKLELSKNGN
jgi:high-affinity Fe2+/Pb2+ permease